MSDAGLRCRHARLAIGGDPHDLPPEVGAHLADLRGLPPFPRRNAGARRPAAQPRSNCRCTRFRAQRARRRARFALAASVVLALLVGGGAGCSVRSPRWRAKSSSTWRTKPAAGTCSEPLSAGSARGECCARPGCEFDARCPVIYASPCPFRGQRVPHLVVQTAERPADRDGAGAREGGGAHGIFRRRAIAACCCRRARAASRVLSRARAVPECRRRRRDLVSRRSLVASTSQPDCGAAEQRRAAPAAIRASLPRLDRAG